jgi:hypothetical protein
MEIGAAALDHHARAAPDHHLARFQRLGELTVPIDRQEVRRSERLAVGGPWQRRLDEPEATGIGHAVGHACKEDFAMCRHEGSLPIDLPDDATDRRPGKASPSAYWLCAQEGPDFGWA